MPPPMQAAKRILAWFGIAVAIVVASLGVYAFVKARAFDASIDKVYDIPLRAVTHSEDPAVVERGKHLSEAVAGCTTPDCHGASGGGGKLMSMGPLGTLVGPNITPSGMGAAYSDGELFRLIRHGVKKDGRSLRFMPA